MSERNLTQNSPGIDSIFIHIPKASGKCIRHALFDVYEVENCLKICSADHGGDYRNSPDLEYFSVTSNTRSIMGHFPVERIALNKSTMTIFYRAVRFTFSSIRDPLNFFISDYKYIPRTPGHNRKHSAQADLRDYLLSRPYNDQYKWLIITDVIGYEKAFYFKINHPFYKDVLLLSAEYIDFGDSIFLWSGAGGATNKCCFARCGGFRLCATH